MIICMADPYPSPRRFGSRPRQRWNGAERGIACSRPARTDAGTGSMAARRTPARTRPSVAKKPISSPSPAITAQRRRLHRRRRLSPHCDPHRRRHQRGGPSPIDQRDRRGDSRPSRYRGMRGGGHARQPEGPGASGIPGVEGRRRPPSG